MELTQLRRRPPGFESILWHYSTTGQRACWVRKVFMSERRQKSARAGARMQARAHSPPAVHKIRSWEAPAPLDPDATGAASMTVRGRARLFYMK